MSSTHAAATGSVTVTLERGVHRPCLPIPRAGTLGANTIVGCVSLTPTPRVVALRRFLARTDDEHGYAAGRPRSPCLLMPGQPVGVGCAQGRASPWRASSQGVRWVGRHTHVHQLLWSFAPCLRGSAMPRRMRSYSVGIGGCAGGLASELEFADSPGDCSSFVWPESSDSPAKREGDRS